MDFTENLDPKKAALLNKIAEISKGQSGSDVVPLLLAVFNKANSEGITFSMAELDTIIEIMKKNTDDPETRSRISLMAQLMHTSNLRS